MDAGHYTPVPNRSGPRSSPATATNHQPLNADHAALLNEPKTLFLWHARDDFPGLVQKLDARVAGRADREHESRFGDRPPRRSLRRTRDPRGLREDELPPAVALHPHVR